MTRGQPLSERELEVVRRLANGESRVQMALGMGLCTTTVGVHAMRARFKLGVPTNCAMVAKASKLGLIG